MRPALVEHPAEPELASQRNFLGTSQSAARRNVNRLNFLDVASLRHCKGRGRLGHVSSSRIRNDLARNPLGAKALGTPRRSIPRQLDVLLLNTGQSVCTTASSVSDLESNRLTGI